MSKETPQTILVVDDEKDIRTTLRTFLKGLGYIVKTAVDGQDALKEFEAFPIDLVISDIRMPKMDGIELMQRIKAKDNDIQVIFLTGYASLENAVDALRENGAFEYLLKPVNDLDALANTIRKALKHSVLIKENQELVQELQKRKKELEVTNRHLHEEIAKRKMVEKELQHMATTDFLTNVSNRRHFIDLAQAELTRCVRYESELCMAILDIDYFKNINDTYGHVTGDAVLKQLAQAVQAQLRETDLFARIGGEEFAIMFTETGLDAAAKTAERIRAKVEKLSFVTKKVTLNATISLGLSSLQAGDTLTSLGQRADKALYKAKNNGRNRLVVL